MGTLAITTVNDMNEEIQNYLTAKEAADAGFATSANAIAQQIRRGVVKAMRAGSVYLIHVDDLKEMKARREHWVEHRHNKRKGKKYAKK